MIRYWRLERVLPPNQKKSNNSSVWTLEGRRYVKDQKEAKEELVLQAGIHYIAVEGPDRILMPDIDILQGLRHKWFWEKRSRPYVPVWNFVKMLRP